MRPNYYSLRGIVATPSTANEPPAAAAPLATLPSDAPVTDVSVPRAPRLAGVPMPRIRLADGSLAPDPHTTPVDLNYGDPAEAARNQAAMKQKLASLVGGNCCFACLIV